MATLYFVDAGGVYLGGFDGAAPPNGAIQVAAAPADARQVWANGAWSAAPIPPPAPPTPHEWLERLSSATQAAIATAAKGDATILLWMMKAAGSHAIDVTNAETIAGVNALVAAGVITSADGQALLTP